MEQTLQNKLIGALIGLAKTTVSNEDLVTDSTMITLLEGLVFYAENQDLICDDLNCDALSAMIERVTEEKRKLAPNCFYCMASCGKNDDYDMKKLDNATDDVRSIKLDLLNGVLKLAPIALVQRDDVVKKFIIKSLFAIGMDDWDEEYLLPIVHESGELYERITISRG